ncbi:MAG TPA: TlpA disulfide reductase family protein [Flavobacterium sp.]|jgi:thiol-disulfide isomerase/thioredoxin
MKKITLILFAAFLASSCEQEPQKDFSARALSEKLQTPSETNKSFAEILQQHKGKPVVIEFWASWCGDCVKAMPKLKELQAAHPEVDYVFISLDKTADKWKAGIQKHELAGDHYLVTDADGMKGEFGKSVNLDWIPRYLIIDKEGKIALYRAIETDFATIDATLNKLK